MAHTGGLAGRKRLQHGDDRYYIHAFLWDDFAAFDRALARRMVEHEPGIRTLAIFAAQPRRMRLERGRWKQVRTDRLGEVHFVRGEWSVMVVTHEMIHAAFHRFRVVVCRRKRTATMDDEESVCYPVGEWAEQCYRWLWKLDPPRKNRLTRKCRAR